VKRLRRWEPVTTTRAAGPVMPACFYAVSTCRVGRFIALTSAFPPHTVSVPIACGPQRANQRPAVTASAQPSCRQSDTCSCPARSACGQVAAYCCLTRSACRQAGARSSSARPASRRADIRSWRPGPAGHSPLPYPCAPGAYRSDRGEATRRHLTYSYRPWRQPAIPLGRPSDPGRDF
jgi:hypothetical protein